MKQILQRLSATIVFALLCLLPVAAQEVTVDSIKYELDFWSNTFEVSGYVDGIKNAKIRSVVSYNGKDIKVTSIRYPGFLGCTSLTSVNIPDSILLCDRCFEKCSNLTSIKIPNGVTSLPSSCFEGCGSLTSINIPTGVTSLGNECFGYCSSLTSINIPTGVTTLDDYCFLSCGSLTSINIPTGVTSLGRMCFFGCSSLTSINIPTSVTSLGERCFSYCGSLTSISIPDEVTSLGEGCFSNCSSLTSIKIPDGVDSLSDNCFSYCSGLKSVTLPHSITSISSSSFTRVGENTPCKLYIDDEFDSNLLGKDGQSYYNIGDGQFVVPVQKIKLSTDNLYINDGDNFQQVQATISPISANNKVIKVTSGDSTIVAIADSGKFVIEG